VCRKRHRHSTRPKKSVRRIEDTASQAKKPPTPHERGGTRVRGAKQAGSSPSRRRKKSRDGALFSTSDPKRLLLQRKTGGDPATDCRSRARSRSRRPTVRRTGGHVHGFDPQINQELGRREHGSLAGVAGEKAWWPGGWVVPHGRHAPTTERRPPRRNDPDSLVVGKKDVQLR